MTQGQEKRINEKLYLILIKIGSMENNLDKILLSLDSFYFKREMNLVLTSLKNFGKQMDLNASNIDSNFKSILLNLDKFEEIIDTGCKGINSKIEEITDQVKKIRHTRMN